MALTNLSQITTSGIATGTDLNIRNITGAAATFTGNVTVGGTLTYDDVTNIDSVGLITARSGISVTGGDVNLTSGNLALASATPMVVASNGSGSLRLGAGGSEKVRITSGGLVGIGTVDPSWGVSTGLMVGDGASAKGITIFSNSANVGDLAFADATSGTARYRGLIRYDHSDNSLALRTNSLERLRITSGGKVLINHTANSNATMVVKTLSDNNHPTIKVRGTNANGYTFFGDEYATDESQFTMGLAYSGASLVTGWGVKVSTSANDTYLSSQDTYSTKHSAIKHDGNGWRFLSNSTSQTVTTGSAVSLTERFRISPTGNIGIGTENAVAKVDIITGTGDGTQNEANCLRLRQRGISGNSMTLQMGVNPTAAGALNQGYAYLQGRFWGGGNNPILLNPKGGNVGIGRTSAHVPLDVNGDTILRTAGQTTQGDITRKLGFTGPNATSNPHSYIAGVADQSQWYQGFGLVFGTVRGNDIGNTLGVERMRITSDGLIGIGTANPRYPLEVNSGNLLVSGSAAGNLILEDRGVGDSSRPFYVVSSDGGKFVINRSNRNASGTTTSSVNSLTLSNGGNLGLGGQTSPGSNIHIGDISANGYELRLSANALTFNRSSNSYIDQVHDTGSILFRMTSSHTEAMRITSGGSVAIGGVTPSDKLHVGGNNAFIRVDRPNGNPGLTLIYNSTNSTRADIDVTTGGDLRFATNSSTERLRIDADGTILTNAATIDNTSSHGVIVAHAPASNADTGYKSIEIGNSNGNNSSRGSTICGQPKSNSHPPYTLIGCWDTGTDADVYYGGGWGSNMRPATRHRFYTNSSYPTANGSGTERLRITGGGFVNIGGNLEQTSYTAQVTRIGGNTDTMMIKGNVGNAFIRFADNDASSDFTLGSDDGSGAGTGAFILYDRNNSVYRVVVNSSGNIGVRNAGPSSKVHIGDLIGSASNDANTTHTSLIIKQTNNDNKSGFYIERSGERKGYYMWMNPGGGSGDGLTFTRNNNGTKSDAFILDRDANLWGGGTFYPLSDNSYDLGSSSNRWRNVYTTDLQLSNEGSQNDVDGTWGSYTIQEGEDELFLINRRNGKKYKFNLTEVN